MTSVIIKDVSLSDFRKMVREHLARGYVLDGESKVEYRDKDNEPLYVQKMIAKSLTV